jgi:hypothetical protein
MPTKCSRTGGALGVLGVFLATRFLAGAGTGIYKELSMCRVAAHTRNQDRGSLHAWTCLRGAGGGTRAVAVAVALGSGHGEYFRNTTNFR